MKAQATTRSDDREDQANQKGFDLDEIDADHRRMWAEIEAIKESLNLV